MQRYSSILFALALMITGCGGDMPAPVTDQTAAAPMQSADQEEMVQEVVIKPVGNELKYETTEFTVKAGSTVRVVMENVATVAALEHNVVILASGTDINTIGMAAMQAGPDKGYVPDNDAVLFHTAIAKPGETTSVEFTAPPAGDYPYVCTFPGHYITMQGVMHSVE